MTVTLNSLDPVQLGITDAELLASPANTKIKITKCTACNDTTTIPTFSINKVPSGGSVGDDNLLINTKALGSRETYECPEVVGQILNASDALYGIASVASQITLSISYISVV